MEKDIVLKYIIKDFRKVVEVLISHPGDICIRLRASRYWLHYDSAKVPDEFNLKHLFSELKKELTKYPPVEKENKINGVIISIEKRSAVDETLSRIRKKTAKKIALLIYQIHMSLEELRRKRNVYLQDS